MAIALSDLVLQLKDDVPVTDSVPTDDQYERAIKSALLDLSRRHGNSKMTTLTILPNVATYNLPSDFIELINIIDPSANTYRDEGILVTSSGLVPVSQNWKENNYITRGSPPTITFYPTPTFDQTRDVWFRASYILETGSYTTLDEESAEVALLLAAATLLDIKATRESEQAWSYQQGDVRVSKEKTAESLSSQAMAKRNEYDRRIKAMIATAGMRANYSSSGR